MFSQDFLSLLGAYSKGTDVISGVDGISKEEVCLISEVELNISGKPVELRDISVLKRDLFPTENVDVYGLLAADILQQHKCSLDFVNGVFQLD